MRFCWLFAPAACATEHGIRLKDLVSIEGVRGNQLVGYGLVMGSTAPATNSKLCSRCKA